jgi:hypothetical protein
MRTFTYRSTFLYAPIIRLCPCDPVLVHTGCAPVTLSLSTLAVPLCPCLCPHCWCPCDPVYVHTVGAPVAPFTLIPPVCQCWDINDLSVREVPSPPPLWFGRLPF